MDPLVEAAIAELTALHADLRKCLAGLPAEALNWQPGPEMNSLGVLITHVLGAERFMVAAAAGALIDRDKEAEFRGQGSDAACLARLLDAADEECRTRLGQITPHTLSATVTGRYAGAWNLMRAVAHTGEHCGQALLTRQLWEQLHTQQS